jgi:tetratricopeptide (TPR) repeat protein
MAAAPMAQAGLPAIDAYNIGRYHANAGHHDEAVKAFTDAVMMNPRYAVAYIGRGKAYNKLGQFKAGYDDLSAALKMLPRYADAYIARAESLAGMGRQNEAIADLDFAIGLDPKSAQALFQRSQILSARGQQAQATNDLNEALKLDPFINTRQQALRESSRVVGSPSRRTYDASPDLSSPPPQYARSAPLPIDMPPTSTTPAPVITAPVPIAQMPIAQMPIAQMPIAQMPIAQMPVAQMPVAQMPVAPAPVAQTPSMGAPAIAAPAMPAPVATTIVVPQTGPALMPHVTSLASQQMSLMREHAPQLVPTAPSAPTVQPTLAPVENPSPSQVEASSASPMITEPLMPEALMPEALLPEALLPEHRVRAAREQMQRVTREQPREFPQPPVEPARDYFERGRSNVASNQMERAVANFGVALRLRPDYPEALAARGQALAALGRWREAIADLDAALQEYPGSSDLYCDHAKVAIGMHDFSTADDDVTIALRLDPQSPEALRLRARLTELAPPPSDLAQADDITPPDVAASPLPPSALPSSTSSSTPAEPPQPMQPKVHRMPRGKVVSVSDDAKVFASDAGRPQSPRVHVANTTPVVVADDVPAGPARRVRSAPVVIADDAPLVSVEPIAIEEHFEPIAPRALPTPVIVADEAPDADEAPAQEPTVATPVQPEQDAADVDVAAPLPIARLKVAAERVERADPPAAIETPAVPHRLPLVASSPRPPLKKLDIAKTSEPESPRYVQTPAKNAAATESTPSKEAAPALRLRLQVGGSPAPTPAVTPAPLSKSEPVEKPHFRLKVGSDRQSDPSPVAVKPPAEVKQIEAKPIEQAPPEPAPLEATPTPTEVEVPESKSSAFNAARFVPSIQSSEPREHFARPATFAAADIATEMNEATAIETGDSNDATAMLARAEEYAASARLNEAADAFDQAIRLDPTLVDAYVGRGFTSLHTGAPEAAADDFAEAIRRAPKHARAHFGMGRALRLLGKYREAVEHLKEATRLDPELGQAYVEMIRTHRAWEISVEAARAGQ